MILCAIIGTGVGVVAGAAAPVVIACAGVGAGLGLYAGILDNRQR